MLRLKFFFKLSGGGQPPNFFYESKDNQKWGLHAKFQGSSSKTVDLHPPPLRGDGIWNSPFSPEVSQKGFHILSGQLYLRSNERSNSNFDCRNGFLGIDYICLDTSHDQIENFSKIVRRGSAPPGGGSDPQFFKINQKIFTKEACMQNFTGLAQKLCETP